MRLVDAELATLRVIAIRGAQTAASNAAMGAVRKTRGATGNRETDETRQAEHHTSMSRTKRIQHRQQQ